MKKIKVFAPASVANVGCGYDTMGFALDRIGEELILTKRADEQLVIKDIIGASLSREASQNVATISIKSFLNYIDSKQGFDVTIIKHFKPGSGLGSSASSASGAVFAANELLNNPLPKAELLQFALEGEAFASKSYHADNVAPSLLGGFQVIRGYDPLDFFEVKTALDLHVLIVFPDVQVKTVDSKGLVPRELPVVIARNQWANTAALIQALNVGNTELLKKAIKDYVAEPARKVLIPKYDDVQRIAENLGVVGFNISGSGPSMFSLFKDETRIPHMKEQVEKLYAKTGIDCKIYHAKMDTEGCKVVS